MYLKTKAMDFVFLKKYLGENMDNNRTSIDKTFLREMNFIEKQKYFIFLLENYYVKKRDYELCNLKKTAKAEEKETAKFNAYDAKAKVLDFLRDNSEKKYFSL